VRVHAEGLQKKALRRPGEIKAESVSLVWAISLRNVVNGNTHLLQKFTHDPTHPDCSRYLHFFSFTAAIVPSLSLGTTSHGPTSHANVPTVILAFISSTQLLGFISFLNKNRTGGGIRESSVCVTTRVCASAGRPLLPIFAASATSRAKPRFGNPSFSIELNRVPYPSEASSTVDRSLWLNNEIANASSGPSS